ncbi:formin-J-like isoform X3 [Schistocerca cancellata]|uniref:formin-J-like isoform X3 n=1 Tax=Schistocerca cancellata TaxID=274614 RepID=UPI00211749F8|nr:formin-J-like isoform X3 [Schistocerca cancellata]
MMSALRAVLVLSLVGAAMSQYKPSYAGSGWSYPGPLPQFTTDVGLDNRVGLESTSSTLSPEEDVASLVSAWPADRQPFWFVNRDQIQEHIGRPQPQAGSQPQTQRPQTQTQQPEQPQAQTQTQQSVQTQTQKPEQTQPQRRTFPQAASSRQ